MFPFLFTLEPRATSTDRLTCSLSEVKHRFVGHKKNTLRQSGASPRFALDVLSGWRALPEIGAPGYCLLTKNLQNSQLRQEFDGPAIVIYLTKKGLQLAERLPGLRCFTRNTLSRTLSEKFNEPKQMLQQTRRELSTSSAKWHQRARSSRSRRYRPPHFQAPRPCHRLPIIRLRSLLLPLKVGEATITPVGFMDQHIPQHQRRNQPADQFREHPCNNGVTGRLSEDKLSAAELPHRLPRGCQGQARTYWAAAGGKFR